ncbi:MAG TPA: hypothetical protein VHD69_01805, partial [Candidatus Paceibacterota bacterium]|nr:hypothetical protein [Candidatus Paceibacterota bacterium]
SLVALVAIGWEASEFAYDHIRIIVFHMNLTDPNVMAQPSNTDTMGDLMLETLGGVLSVLGCKSARMPLWNKRKTGRSEIQS